MSQRDSNGLSQQGNRVGKVKPEVGVSEGSHCFHEYFLSSRRWRNGKVSSFGGTLIWTKLLGEILKRGRLEEIKSTRKSTNDSRMIRPLTLQFYKGRN